MNRVWKCKCPICGVEVVSATKKELISGDRRSKEGRMKTHECKTLDYCICDTQALEPREECPIHGCGEYSRRCIICGRFMPYKKARG